MPLNNLYSIFDMENNWNIAWKYQIQTRNFILFVTHFAKFFLKILWLGGSGLNKLFCYSFCQFFVVHFQKYQFYKCHKIIYKNL